MALEFAINQLVIALILEFRRIGGGITTTIPWQGLNLTITDSSIKGLSSKFMDVFIKVVGWPKEAFIKCEFKLENKHWWPIYGKASTPYISKGNHLVYEFTCTYDKQKGDVTVSITGK